MASEPNSPKRSSGDLTQFVASEPSLHAIDIDLLAAVYESITFYDRDEDRVESRPQRLRVSDKLRTLLGEDVDTARLAREMIQTRRAELIHKTNEMYPVGSELTGTVDLIAHWGAYLRLAHGEVLGMIHQSTSEIGDLALGEEVTVTVEMAADDRGRLFVAR